jgi:hypothetical protein
MDLRAELERIAAIAAGHAAAGESVEAVLAAEPLAGDRCYVCAFASRTGREWLVLDESGDPVTRRADVREAISLAALCEVAVDTAGGGDVAELRSQLAALRLIEGPPGIDEAEEAALELERTLGTPPRLATPVWLDELGAATRRLERALGEAARSPFSDAMQHAMGAVDALADEVEERYKLPLE